MKKTVIIVLIIVFSIIAICLGVLVAMTPEPAEPAWVDPHTPNNLIEILGIDRQIGYDQERLIAIKTYQGEMSFEDIREIAGVGGLEYYELDPNSNDYLLIVPFEINGTMKISSLAFDKNSEEYITGSTVFPCNKGNPLPDNYSLLLRYSRPYDPQYEINLTQGEQGEQLATYQISNMELIDKKIEKYAPVKTIQLVNEYIEGNTNPITESYGNEIKIASEDE